jgi:hypothetical protein
MLLYLASGFSVFYIEPDVSIQFTKRLTLSFDTRLLSLAYYFKSNYFKKSTLVSFCPSAAQKDLFGSGFMKGILRLAFAFPTSAVTFHPSHPS